MVAKVEAEFESVDLAERAVRVIRERVPSVTAMYIRPLRSDYDREGDWSWTRNFAPENRRGPVIRELLPERNPTDGPRNAVLDYSPLRETERPSEPDLRQSAVVTCLASEPQIRRIAGLIRNLGGLHVRIHD